MRRVLVLLATAALSAGALTAAPAAVGAPPPAATAAAESASVPDELLVGYAAGASARERADARSRAGARLVEVVVPAAAGRRVVELVATPTGGRGQAQHRFEADPKVDYAEPNWVYQHAATSNDPYYTDGSLWGMYGDATSPANPYGSQAGEAWAAGNTGSSTVYVGVIDEGVQYTHPDLAANSWVNPGETAGNGVDDDGNGYVDDDRGWDFDGGNNSVYDGTQDDHGTHVAGTIGARGGNGEGVAGVAWNVKLIPAKFLGRRGGTTANAVKAVDYLTDLKSRHKLNLVASNNSWGGGGESTALADAIERANTANILFIAAAGNGGSDGIGDDNDITKSYPSGYANDNIIAVASITSSGAKSTFSNYGATTVDLGAPGSGVMSTLPDSTYGSYSGTSMATPHVTGGAALYAAGHPGATAAAVKNAILGAAVPTPSLAGKTVTGGRLNVSGFLLDSTAPASPTKVQASAFGTDGAIDVSWTAPADSDVASYSIYRDGVAVASVSASATTWRDTGRVNNQTHAYAVAAVDVAGNVSGLSEPGGATAVNTTAPAKPVGLVAVAGDGKVDLTWTANAEVDLAGYEVWRSDVTAGPIQTLGKVTAWRDSTVENMKTYTYWLVAYDNSSNDSVASDPATATPQGVSISLTAEAAKSGPNNKVVLRWSGTTVSNVDVWRDGVKLTTTANDGYYEDNLKRQTGDFTYKVCEAGTTTCSANATAKVI